MSSRGERRREVLVAAAATLLGRDGPQALSARAVATEADVPLAAVSYYFATVDDLVRAAAQRLFEGYLDAATRLVEREPAVTGDRALAGLVVRVWLDPTDGGPDPRRVRSLLVSLATSADAPALAPRLRRYDQALQGLVVALLGRAGRNAGRVRVLLAALDGFALARLSGVPLLGSPEPEETPTGAGDASGPAGLVPEVLLTGLREDLLLVLDDLAPVQAPPS